MGSERERAALEAAIRKKMEGARHLASSQAGSCSASATDVHAHLQGLQCPEVGAVTVKGVVMQYKRNMTEHEPSWHTAPLVRCGDHALVVDTTISQFYSAAIAGPPEGYEIVPLQDWAKRIITLTAAEKVIDVQELDGPQGESRAISSFLAATSSSSAAAAAAASSSSSSASGPVQLAIAQAKSKVMGLLGRRPPQ
jgi:hypothetical protein